MKLLIAYDGTEHSDAAIEDLTRAGLPQEVNALVVSIDNWARRPAVPPQSDSVANSEAQVRATSATERLRNGFPGWVVRSAARVGPVKALLVAEIRSWQPDLIVLGSHGRSAVIRAIGGSVSQYVLHRANHSVRIGRRSPNAIIQPPRLLIGVGGAQPSKTAVTIVASREWAPGTEAHVVGAIDAMLSQAGVADQLAYGHLRDVINDAVSQAAELLQKAGLIVSTEVRDAIPVDLILSRAREWRADCIFVGSRNFGNVGRALIGSTSSTVSATAHCSVEVVHRGRQP